MASPFSIDLIWAVRRVIQLGHFAGRTFPSDRDTSPLISSSDLLSLTFVNVKLRTRQAQTLVVRLPRLRRGGLAGG